MANVVKLSAILVVFCACLLTLVPAFPQRFNFIQRPPFRRSFRSFSRPSFSAVPFRNSFRDFSDEDLDDFGSFRHFGNFRESLNFRPSNSFGRARFGSPFTIHRNRFFDDDQSFEEDD